MIPFAIVSIKNPSLPNVVIFSLKNWEIYFATNGYPSCILYIRLVSLITFGLVSLNHQVLNFILYSIYYYRYYYYFQRGQPTDTMFFLGLGSIEVTNYINRNHINNRNNNNSTNEDTDMDPPQTITITADTSEGCFLGYADFILHQPRSHTVQATKRCTIGILERGAFEKLLLKYPSERQTILTALKAKRRIGEILSVVSE